MTDRIYNFSAGPAVLPVSVLEEARENLLSLGKTGIGILEHSHRGKAFLAVYEETVALCREVGSIPDDYSVLLLQGGASTQFFMVPMAFFPKTPADYRYRRLVAKAVKRSGLATPHRLYKRGPQFLLHPQDVSIQRTPGVCALHVEQYHFRH
jgi:phosphoserine aminotransferase